MWFKPSSRQKPALFTVEMEIGRTPIYHIPLIFWGILFAPDWQGIKKGQRFASFIPAISNESIGIDDKLAHQIFFFLLNNCLCYRNFRGVLYGLR